MDTKEYSKEIAALRKMMDAMGLTITGTMSFPIPDKITNIHIWVLDESLETVYRKTTQVPKIGIYDQDYSEAFDAYLEAIECILKYKEWGARKRH